MTPVTHPDGCRCPGCLPGQYVMRQAAPRPRNAAQRRPQQRSGGDLMTFDMGCLGVLLGFAAISAVCGWVARNGHVLLAALPGVGAAVLVVVAVVCFNRWSARPPKGRLKVEAGPASGPPMAAMPPPLPICLHVNAIPVLNITEDETLAWLCPRCDTRLPEDFGKVRRPCCGTPHGLWHLDNCPHYREWRDITGQWPS